MAPKPNDLNLNLYSLRRYEPGQVRRVLSQPGDAFDDQSARGTPNSVFAMAKSGSLRGIPSMEGLVLGLRDHISITAFNISLNSLLCM